MLSYLHDVRLYQPSWRPYLACQLLHGSFYGLSLHVRPVGSTVVQPSTVVRNAQRKQEQSPTVRHEHSTVKRKVALHVAYLGTGYRGLQRQGPTDEQTLEAVLLKTLLVSGAILESNMSNTHRIQLSRSSRTDKGVHSLSTVLGLKLECPSDNFNEDPEGSALASIYNERLPSELKILSIQRVTKSFNARVLADRRTYEYCLPATVLGMHAAGDAQTQGQVMQRLRECLALFMGNHAFHNYTQRRRYRPGIREMRSGFRPHAKQRAREAAIAKSATGQELQAQSGADPAIAGSSSDQIRHSDRTACSDGEHMGSTAAESCPEAASSAQTSQSQPGTRSPSAFSTAAVDDDDASGSDNDQEPEAEAHWSTYTDPQVVDIRWLEEVDEDDRVVGSHYRTIYDIRADDPQPIMPGGIPCVRVTLTGQSFMLHQIRHMVGAAVATALRLVPLEFIRASLTAPARTDFPLAPAQVLVLADTTFNPFPSGGGATPSSATNGDRLSLQQAGQTQRAEFRRQVLNPALNDLLQGEVWERWQHELGRVTYPAAQVSDMICQHASWLERVRAAKAERLRQRAERRLAAQGHKEDNVNVSGSDAVRN